jgi:hypothetical protein
MQIEYESKWMSPTVELIKCLEEMKQPNLNEKIGSIDYIIEDGKNKKLIRAMVDENNNATPAYVNTIRDTIKELEEEKFDKVLILSNRITDEAHDILSDQSNLDVITPNMKHNFNLIEVISAVQKKTRDLCILKCGKVPESREDCKGKNGQSYVCEIRRISDDSTFHARMKWKDMIFEDFKSLCEIEKTLEVN